MPSLRVLIIMLSVNVQFHQELFFGYRKKIFEVNSDEKTCFMHRSGHFSQQS